MDKVVTAKFVCVEKGEVTYSENGPVTVKVVLHAVHGTYGSSDENKKFFTATPNGKIEMSVVNPQAAESFTVGKAVYVDFRFPQE